jgi:hypothetical protein
MYMYLSGNFLGVDVFSLALLLLLRNNECGTWPLFNVLFIGLLEAGRPVSNIGVFEWKFCWGGYFSLALLLLLND